MSAVGAAAWPAFAAQLAEIGQVPTATVGDDARLVEDLGFDSLALAEVTLLVVEEYGGSPFAAGLSERRWEGLTAGELFRGCVPEADR